MVALSLSIASLLTVVLSSPVLAASATRIQFGRCYEVRTASVASKKIPLTSSQTLHKKGVSTTISVSSSQIKSVTASTNLTAGVELVFGSLSTSLGVANSKSYTTGTIISFTVPSSTASGRYRIEHIYPGRKVTQLRHLNEAIVSVVTWQRSIAYAPRANDAYRTLTRYSNP